MTSPDLVVIGNLIVDDLVFEDGATRLAEAGGAVVYAALGAALWGVRPGIVSVAGDDYPAAMLDTLAARGVDLAGVRRADGPGLRVWLLYEGAVRRLVHRLGRPSHEEASPTPREIPRTWLDTRAIHLSPAPLSQQAALVRDLSGATRAHLSLDPHTPLSPATLAEWRDVLAQVDALFVSDWEVEFDDPVGQVGSLSTGRLRRVALKRGALGGVLLSPPDAPRPWPARASRVVDPTGAGDAFAGGFLAGHLAGAPVERALAQALVAASFAMEGWGASSLAAATPADAAERLAAWFPETPGD
jgi:ribokinase